MHIAVDLDDVTVDFFQGVIDSMYREFGVRIDKRDCTSWDENPVKTFDWRAYGFKSWWDWMQKRDWLWATFPAVPGAIGGINALRQAGHYVEALTMKPSWAEPQVWKWLGRWRPPFNQVTLVPSGEKKSEHSTANLLIDDKPQNCFEWLDTDRPAILFTQPWNLKTHGVAKAFDWQGVLELAK